MKNGCAWVAPLILAILFPFSMAMAAPVGKSFEVVARTGLPTPAPSAEAWVVTAEQIVQTADRFFQAGDFEGALRYYRAALEIDPRFAKALEGAGYCCLKLSVKRDAYDYLSKASAMMPGDMALELLVAQLRNDGAAEDQPHAGHVMERNIPTQPGDVPEPTYQGPYVCLNLPVAFVEGDFDGATALQSEATGEWVAVPNVSEGAGYGASLGWRGLGRGLLSRVGVEVSVARSLKNVRWEDADGEADHNLFEAQARYFLNDSSPLRVSGIIGYCMSSLWVRGGSYHLGVLGDTVYRMQGPTVGVGLTAFWRRPFFTDIGLLYRYQTVSDITAADGIAQAVQGGLHGHGFGFKIGLGIQRF